LSNAPSPERESARRVRQSRALCRRNGADTHGRVLGVIASGTDERPISTTEASDVVVDGLPALAQRTISGSAAKAPIARSGAIASRQEERRTPVRAGPLLPAKAVAPLGGASETASETPVL
jgi:hypothetical protein